MRKGIVLKLFTLYNSIMHVNFSDDIYWTKRYFLNNIMRIEKWKILK